MPVSRGQTGDIDWCCIPLGSRRAWRLKSRARFAACGGHVPSTRRLPWFRCDRPAFTRLAGRAGGCGEAGAGGDLHPAGPTGRTRTEGAGQRDQAVGAGARVAGASAAETHAGGADRIRGVGPGSCARDGLRTHPTRRLHRGAAAGHDQLSRLALAEVSWRVADPDGGRAGRGGDGRVAHAHRARARRRAGGGPRGGAHRAARYGAGDRAKTRRGLRASARACLARAARGAA